jgi:YidC/Oxa1 family membrane protein insertase
MMSTMSSLLAENALFSSIGKIFHPVFELFAYVLAAIYSVVPNYAFAIFGLTVLIMLCLTPVTIKSTKSMIAMQRLQPEMKKLQTKYKGPENRELLQQEMMKLYKENGTSPFGACIPPLLQMPFLIVLYSLIRGLSYGTLNKAGQVIKATPRYLPKNSKMYENLVKSHGQMKSFFGMDLSSTPFTHHGSDQAVLMIPYLALIAIAVFLQYYQMKQMNSRNPQAAQANPQMQQMQKFFPIIFGLIYLRVPAGATIYMVVSSAMRIGTQDIMFRTGMVTPAGGVERSIGSGAKPSGGTKPAGGAKTSSNVIDAESTPAPKPAAKPGSKPAPAKGGTGANGKSAPPRATNGKAATNGNKQAANGKSAGADKEVEQAAGPKEHPRSRAKRTRKAR